MKIPRLIQWLLVLPWSSSALTAIAHGPHRGLNGGIVNTLSLFFASGGFALAVLLYRKPRQRMAMVILGGGLMARCVFEVTYSKAKQWAVATPFLGEGTLEMVIYYLVNFIAPALIYCDWLHLRRTNKSLTRSGVDVEPF